MVCRSKGSHIGSALSYVDILAVLYSEILKYNCYDPKAINRDRFILSKGHACSSLYACLSICGFFKLSELKTYGKDGSFLMNHVSHKVKGVEFSTGSLGHGLSYGLGIAKSLKINNNNSKVYVLLGDGELSEGSNFEAMLFAAHHKLDNLFLIIDYNNLQSLTTVSETLNIEPIKDKFDAFGWDSYVINGHDLHEISNVLKSSKNKLNNKPKVFIASTTKGKGVSFMSNKVEWHYKNPSFEEFKLALKEIIHA